MSDFISRQAAIDEIKALYEWHDTVTEARAVDHLKRLPSAQPDLSGYSDRLWERAYDCGYERCKQDAIDAVDVKCLHRGIVKGIQEIIEDLQSAQPEQECEKCIFKPFKQFQPKQRKGEWIKISPANIYECSACGQNVMTNDIDAYRFCHGCGADMRGEQNGND